MNVPAKVTPSTPAPASLFTAEQVELIKRQICPGASDDELKMFLFDCERSRLDPFARQIYSIERREKYRQGDQWRWRIKRVTQVSIDGFRLIAERSGEYAGQLGPEWCGLSGEWCDVWLNPLPPAAARVAVLRKDFEKPLWTPATFNEYCPRNDKGEPTGLWARMPAVMIAKCAEAMALRRAFPRELSGFYTSDEMMQAAQQEGGAAMAMRPLAQDLNDEIPDFAGAASSAEGAAADAPSPATGGAPTPYGLKLQLLYSAARLEAMKGELALNQFFNYRDDGTKRPKEEKEELRKIKAELVALYPK